MAGASPFFRDDTIFGVCEALGEDFRFNPDLLRVLIGAGLLFSPVNAFLAYGVGALLVIVSRWWVPDPAAVEVPVEASGEAEDRLLETEDEALKLAA